MFYCAACDIGVSDLAAHCKEAHGDAYKRYISDRARLAVRILCLQISGFVETEGGFVVTDKDIQLL